MLRNSLLIVILIAVAACGTHRERYVVLPPEFDQQVDTLRVTALLKKRKPIRKGVMVFQPMREGKTTDNLTFVTPLKEQGYDIFIVEFPFVDNPLERKSSVTLSNRVYDYLQAHAYFTEQRNLAHWTYFSVGLALPWAMETALNVTPDSMVIYRSVDQSPLENRRLLMQNDTMSTDKTWQPVDEYMDVDEAWQMLVDNVESNTYSGIFTFEGLPDRLWGEWHRYPYQSNFSMFRFPITWVFEENDASISATFYNLLVQMHKAYENRVVEVLEQE